MDIIVLILKCISKLSDISELKLFSFAVYKNNLDNLLLFIFIKSIQNLI